MTTARKSTRKAISKAAPEAKPAEDVVNEELVQEAADWIREKVADTVNHGMAEIGDYLLEKLFGGDVEQVRSHAPNKNASFRALAERCGTTELPMSRSMLHAAVGTAVMRRQLPQGSQFLLLPPSHQGALLPLRDPKKIEKAAQRAMSKRLRVRDLKIEVKEEREKAVDPDAPQRGRRPLPVIVRTLTRSATIVEKEGVARQFTKAQIDELDDEGAATALKVAKALMGNLEKLVEKLEARESQATEA